jgi:hypothetical protein
VNFVLPLFRDALKSTMNNVSEGRDKRLMHEDPARLNVVYKTGT